MDNYFSIFQGILSTDGTFLNYYLDGLQEHGQFGEQNNDEAVLVQHITSLLTTSTSRILGIYLLDKFLDNCSTDVLEKKGNLWTTLVLKACNTQEIQSDTPITFHVLNKLIQISQQVPDLAKSFIVTHISKIYECLTNVPSSKLRYALNCIETCLRAYPGSSGPSRGAIERFLWKNIDHIDFEVVQKYGKCLHLLQQVKGGGVQGVNHKTQWKNYQFQLLGGIHSVYNKMFTNCVEMYEEKIEEEKLPWESDQIEFDPDPVKKSAQMYIRCRNLITYLNIALREPFPVQKPILMKKILNVIIRGLSVNCSMLQRNPIADNIALSILLPELHIDILNLLNVAFKIFRGHLRPYSNLILGLLVDELKWSSAKNVQGDQKNLWSLRKNVYDTISMWCKLYNSGNSCETIAEYLFQEILGDITPTQNEFTLKVLSGARKHMSKKARRQLQNAQNEKFNTANSHTVNSNRKQTLSDSKKHNLCIAALRCFQEVIFSVANFLKPTILKVMHTSIAQISATFYEVAQNPTYLYTNKNCRIEIYNALYAILITTHHFCPPPTELILAIIRTAAARDSSHEVRFRCSFILQNLEKIIHPQKESLLFAIEARDIRNTFIKMGSENLLREFDISLSISSCNDNTIDNDEVQQVMDKTNLQLLNKSLTNHENDCLKDKEQTDVTSTSISEKTSVIENEDINDVDTISINDQVDNVNELETVENQVVDDGDISPEESHTSNENIVDLPAAVEIELRVEDDVNVARVNEEKDDAMSNCNSGEPMTKKQKLCNDHNETDEAENSTIEFSMDNEDNILEEIASQFVDELE